MGATLREVYVVGKATAPFVSVEVPRPIKGANEVIEVENRSSYSGIHARDGLGLQLLEHLFLGSGISPADVDTFCLGSAISDKVERDWWQASAKDLFLALKDKYSDLEIKAPCTLVEKACSTSLFAIWYAIRKILLGHAEIAVAGGIDYMCRTLNSIVLLGLTDPGEQRLMAALADEKAHDLGYTKEDHDTVAFESYLRALKYSDGHDLVPIRVVRDGKLVEIKQDEEIAKYRDLDPERVRQIIKRTRAYPGCLNGIITPRNASQYATGGAFTAFASGDAVKKHNLRPIAKFISYAGVSGKEPKDFIDRPAKAIKAALDKASRQISDLDCVEINTAFLTAVLSARDALGIDISKINMRGDAVFLHGHAIGATGARLTNKLLTILEEDNLSLGGVSLCNGRKEATGMIFGRN